MNKDSADRTYFSSTKQKCGAEFLSLRFVPCAGLKREGLQRYITKAIILGMKSLLLPKEL